MTVLGILLLLLTSPAVAQENSIVVNEIAPSYAQATEDTVGGMRFNEIAWAGSIRSANDEWIELYNPGEEDVDVTGYKLIAADGSPSVTLKGMVLAKRFFLLERTDDTSTPALADMLYTGSLSNEGETLRLYSSDGTLIDEVIGWSGGDNETKTTMARDGLVWKSGITEGTPAAPNAFFATPTPPVPTEAEPPPSPLAQQEYEERTPVTAEAPIAAAHTPITIRGEEANIPLWAGLGVALLVAGLSALILLPRSRGKRDTTKDQFS